MPCTTPCTQCARSGLPILFTRYAATYGVTPAGLAALDPLRPGGHFSAMPGGVALKVGRYNVRMLRAGYLYIRTEVAQVRTPEWEAYVVDPHGYLTKVRIDAPAATKPMPACRPEMWGANRSMVWVKDAAALTSLHYVFHPDPIDPRHLMQVIDKAPDTHMQRFDIAAWVKGNTGQKHTCLPDALDRQVVEYAALADEHVQEMMEGQFFGLMGAHPEDRGWGHYEEQRIDRPFGSNAGGAALGRAQGLRTVARVLGSYRFNRTTGKVYVLRPRQFGGNAILDWHRVKAHVNWTALLDLKPGYQHDVRQRDARQNAGGGYMMRRGLVLYWPPLDPEDPERQGEDIIWVGQWLCGQPLWSYIRTFMEEGMDVVPAPQPDEYRRKGRSSMWQHLWEGQLDSYVRGAKLQGHPDPRSAIGVGLYFREVPFLIFNSMAQWLCWWPTFPEEWNSDCGQKRRERGIGPEEPLRWKAKENQPC